MKATELLVSQHREVEQLFEQLESVEEGDERIVREELARNLIGHMVIEEEMFYPAMREAMPGQISLAEVEHAAARYALAQVLSAQPGDPTFRAKVMVLEQMVRNHVDMEEKEILPRSESALGTEQQQQLTRSMEGRYEEIVSEDFMGILKQRLLHEMPQMLVPRAAAGKTAAKKRTVRATAKKAAPAAKRGAGATRGASAKRGAGATRGASATRGTSAKRGASATRGAPAKRTADTKRATSASGASGTKRQTQPSTRRTGMAGGRQTGKPSARKRA